MSDHHNYPCPRTVSDGAKSILSVSPIQGAELGAGVPLDDVGAWESLLRQYDEAITPLYESVLNCDETTTEVHQIKGVTVRTVKPVDQAQDRLDKIVLNLHGGGYALLGGDLSVIEAVDLARVGGFTVISVDYRMPPRHPFPAALEDALTVYQFLLKTYSPRDIAITGASAGGGLSAALTLRALEMGMPKPAALVLTSPWSDLSKTGDTYHTNEGVDPILTSYDTGLDKMALLYANGRDLEEPLLSPVYADFSGDFPPTLLISGTRDLLLSCTVRLHRVLREHDVEAELHVFEAMWHGFSGIPEHDVALDESVHFLEKHMSI